MTNMHENPSSSLTGTRQTMASWAKVIDSYAAIPLPYQSTCTALLGGRTALPSLILTPATRELSRKVSEKLLWTDDGVLTVLESEGKQIQVLQFELAKLRDLEVGTILLYSWITVSGITTDGAFASSTFTFNTATLRHFESVLAQARGIGSQSALSAPRSEQAKLDYIGSSDYKFMNFAKTTLHPEAAILDSLWQPEIRNRVLGFLGLGLYRTIATAHLLVVTDKELLFIHDDARVKRVKGMRYGGVWHYIPRRSIVANEITESTGGLLTLTLILLYDGRVDMQFAANKKDALLGLQRSLR